MNNIKYLLSIFASLPILSIFGQNSPYIYKVDEYVPAPGQFINILPKFIDGDNAETMVNKCTEAIANNAGGVVSLGAWGGYITFHFDHPVINVPNLHDIYIKGNAIVGSSEAGIVMVSRDDNCNGLPDDEWYEMNGSADIDSATVCYGYELTYVKTQDLQDIPWQDNYGNNGLVERNNFHTQEYYPLWLEESITFSGTRLPNNAFNTSSTGQNWVLNPFRFGYVDNTPNQDTVANSFDISWAVEPISRMPVNIDHIDYVRVYTGLNQSAGWLGETSTEVTGAQDLHPDAESAIRQIHTTPISSKIDLWGRRKESTLNIITIKN